MIRTWNGFGIDSRPPVKAAMSPAQPARMHLLPAKQAPVVVVLRRKPSRLYHVVRINTRTGILEEGSWFTGRLYSMRCDVSFDGNWLVYLALGAKGASWNGISMLPRLTTVAEGANMGTWNGGGYWSSSRVLKLNCWLITKGQVPFRTEPLTPEYGGEDLSVLYPRMERDGWCRVGDNWGADQVVADASKHTVERVGDDGWEVRPSRRHPTLRCWYAGYLKHGYTFRFRLREDRDFLDDPVDWATYDSEGQLVVARQGVVTVFALLAKNKLTKRFEYDLESLAPKRRREEKNWSP